MPRSAFVALLPLVLAFGAAAASQPASPPDVLPATASSAAYRAEIEGWRDGRVERLTADNGWLTLAGLHPLVQGEQTLGSDPASDVVLPSSAPPRVGTLRIDGRRATIEIRPGVAVTVDGEPLAGGELVTDATGDPTILELGPVSFFVIERGEELFLRVRDRDHPDRARFAGIDSFPIDEAWRFDARFVPYEPVKQIPVANILGIVSDEPSWGAVVFERGGSTYSIDALAEPGDEELFLIFADETSGKETYGAGRYLYVDAPDEDGRVDLDFNRAYNPPCAFTEFATCPLPPRQNRLPLRIEAGEKTYKAAGH